MLNLFFKRFFRLQTSDFRLQKGFIALTTVLIILAITLAVGIGLGLRSISEMKMSLQKNQSSQAYYLANLCAEGALQRIRDSTLFEGSGSLSLSQGSCTYTVTKLTDQNRNIRATGMVGNIIRKAKITIDKINPKINITSWQQVADF